MTDTPEEKGLAGALRVIRRHGLWVLAALAAFPSLDLVALVKGAEAARNATRLTPGDFVIAVLALAGAVEVLRFRRPWRSAVAPVAAFAWVAVAAVAAIVAALTQEEYAAGGALKEIVQLVEVLVVAYGWVSWAPAESRGSRRRDLDRALYALAGAVTANVLFALAQCLYVEHVFHVRGFFAHRNVLGTFLAVTLPVLGAAGAAPGRHWGVRAWLLLTVALGLFVTSSGGLFAAAALGIVAAVVSVAAAGRDAAGTSSLRRCACGLAAAAGVAVICLVAQPLLAPRLRREQLRSVDLFPEDENERRQVSMRVRRWAAAVDCVRKNAGLGVGPGQFQRRIGGYYNRFFPKPAGRGDDVAGYDVRFDEPGSQGLYEVTAVEMGLAGLVAVGFFLASALARAACEGFLAGHRTRPDRAAPSAGRFREEGGSGLGAGALGSALAAVVACLFSSVMVRGVGLVFVMVLALGEREGEEE